MRISVVIPFHFMDNWEFFLMRAIRSIEVQTFKDYEIILTKSGRMAENTNHAMRSAQGELIKILYMDDYFEHDRALQVISDSFSESCQWLATGCVHQTIGEMPKNPHLPRWTEDIHRGNNCIGSPSVVTFRNDSGLQFFDEKLSYMLDVDLYRRYYDLYGPPCILNDLNVVIGVGPHQTSNLMSDEEKLEEAHYTIKKHA